MMDDRAAVIVLGGEQYELLLTTRATKEIAKRYGGIDNLGEMLSGAENIEAALDEVIWLITTLANQPILIANLRDGGKRELLIASNLELLTSPGELAQYRNAIRDAMAKGMRRDIVSEETDEKNMAGG